MGKATLQYNLEDIDDRMAFKCATKGEDMALAIFSILNCNEFSKHHEGKYDVYEIKEIIYRILDDHDIRLDELIR